MRVTSSHTLEITITRGPNERTNTHTHIQEIGYRVRRARLISSPILAITNEGHFINRRNLYIRRLLCTSLLALYSLQTKEARIGLRAWIRLCVASARCGHYYTFGEPFMYTRGADTRLCARACVRVRLSRPNLYVKRSARASACCTC